MARAYRCDNCKTLYEKDYGYRQHCVYIGKTKLLVTVTTRLNEFVTSSADLCPNCFLLLLDAVKKSVL